MSDTKELDKNFAFFKDNLKEWLADNHRHRKHVVIADQEVKGWFDSFPNALDYASANLTLGKFIIQEVIGEDERIGFLRSAF